MTDFLKSRWLRRAGGHSRLPLRRRIRSGPGGFALALAVCLAAGAPGHGFAQGPDDGNVEVMRDTPPTVVVRLGAAGPSGTYRLRPGDQRVVVQSGQWYCDIPESDLLRGLEGQLGELALCTVVSEQGNGYCPEWARGALTANWEEYQARPDWQALGLESKQVVFEVPENFRGRTVSWGNCYSAETLSELRAGYDSALRNLRRAAAARGIRR